MPLVLINPEIKPSGEPVAGGEGCLSFPEIYAEISRPGSVEVKALNEKLKPVEFRAGGLLSRAIQHEVDHLNGILFIDRMTKKTKEEIRDELDALRRRPRRNWRFKKAAGQNKQAAATNFTAVIVYSRAISGALNGFQSAWKTNFTKPN